MIKKTLGLTSRTIILLILLHSCHGACFPGTYKVGTGCAECPSNAMSTQNDAVSCAIPVTKGFVRLDSTSTQTFNYIIPTNVNEIRVDAFGAKGKQSFFVVGEARTS